MEDGGESIVPSLQGSFSTDYESMRGVMNGRWWREYCTLIAGFFQH